MARRRMGALALAAVLATGLAACGGDDDGDDVGLEDVDNGNDSNDESSDTTVDLGDVPEGLFGSEECTELFTALAGFGGAFSGEEFDFDQVGEVFERLGEAIPEVEDDAQVLADAYREFADALGDDADFNDPDTFSSPEFQRAVEAFSSEEVSQASDNISQAMEEACPATG